MKASDITLACTCALAPEQYDAIDRAGNIIGYIRTRWGYCEVWCPDARSEDIVYMNRTRGFCSFANQWERKWHLGNAKRSIAKWWSNRPDSTSK